VILGALTEFTKTSGRPLFSDFLGGVDPTGARTFQYGLSDIHRSKKARVVRRTVAVAGGTVGGAAVLPPAVGAILGAGKGFIQQKGGLGKRLVSAGREAARVAKKPYTSLYHGVKAKRTISRAIKGKPVTTKSFTSLDKLIASKVPKEYHGVIPEVRRGLLEGATKKAVSIAPKTLAAVNKELTGEVALGAGTLGLSGAVAGGSAYVQYGKGRRTAKYFQKKLSVGKPMKPGALTKITKESAFKSKAQRRAFYHLKSKGEMTQSKIDEWEADTPKQIPERVKKKD
jgi:hypothetical protein